MLNRPVPGEHLEKEAIHLLMSQQEEGRGKRAGRSRSEGTGQVQGMKERQ